MLSSETSKAVLNCSSQSLYLFVLHSVLLAAFFPTNLWGEDSVLLEEYCSEN